MTVGAHDRLAAEPDAGPVTASRTGPGADVIDGIGAGAILTHAPTTPERDKGCRRL
jgi:hypothetical protein